jgi:hypothetical protein
MDIPEKSRVSHIDHGILHASENGASHSIV